MSALAYLTRRQKEILDFITAYVEHHNVAPTLREIKDHFGLSSYGTVHKHLRLLQDKGYLEREWNQKRGLALASAEREPSSGAVPFLGRIAAGEPIDVNAGQETLEVPAHLMGGVDDHYVLEVSGTSMIGEGIFDGDLVVVKKNDRASKGEMVVALVGDEVTLKRFFPEGRQIRLQPSNPAMEPIMVDAEDLRVQGVVVGLMRRF